MKLLKVIFTPLGWFKRIKHKIYIAFYVRPRLIKCGRRTSIDYNFIGTFSNISIGHDTAIGPNCVFYASMARLSIGNYVMISPNVTIITGSHKTDVLGKYMIQNSERDKIKDGIGKYDSPVIIEDDVWIGSNVLILKGVTIGKGSIIHAGQIITKSIPPYTIYVNEKIKIKRFSEEEVKEHEARIKEK